MELGPQNHSRDGLLGPNSITVVYMDPLGEVDVLVTLGFKGLGTSSSLQGSRGVVPS